MSAAPVEVDVEGRTLRLSNLDKVLWPETGFTKGQMIDYYAKVAPVMLNHLRGRPITLKRYPNGVAGLSFFEKNCPSHRPGWMQTATMGDVSYCLVDEPADLVWLANLAAIELHPTLAREPDLEQPTALVVDLDPGAPADILTCIEVARLCRDALGELGLDSWAKTSGSKGMQMYAPLAAGTDYAQSKPFAQAFAQRMEREHPKLVVSNQDKRARRGKVLIDWSQNTASKTTVAAYSVRARDVPSVSTPVTWEELAAAAEAGDAARLRFSPDQVLARVAASGDLMAEVLQPGPSLPDLKTGGL